MSVSLLSIKDSDTKNIFLILLLSAIIYILNLLPDLRNEGINAESVMSPRSILEKMRLLKNISRFDIIYLQKKLFSPIEAGLFMHFARRLIFDFDDTIYYRDDSHPSLESKLRLIKFKYIARFADIVVAGNRN